MLHSRATAQTAMTRSASRRAWRRSRCSFSAGFLGSFIFLDSAGLLESSTYQFRQILHGERAMIHDRLVKSPQVELIARLPLDLLSQAIKGGSADEIRGKL